MAQVGWPCGGGVAGAGLLFTPLACAAPSTERSPRTAGNRLYSEWGAELCGLRGGAVPGLPPATWSQEVAAPTVVLRRRFGAGFSPSSQPRWLTALPRMTGARDGALRLSALCMAP